MVFLHGSVSGLWLVLVVAFVRSFSIGASCLVVERRGGKYGHKEVKKKSEGELAHNEIFT
jgi:hypothetical protein